MSAALFQKPCRFIAGAASPDSLPQATHPEVAFIGRSNAGKSSLINALVGQKALARTSQSPGATKQINFFLLADTLMLVDMPGYGFAKVSKAQKDDWEQLIMAYLTDRPLLKRVLVLIDARRGLMDSDREFMAYLDDMASLYQLVLTKCDALGDKELTAVLQSVTKTIQSHAAAHPEVVATSAERKTGIDTLQERLLPFATGTT